MLLPCLKEKEEENQAEPPLSSLMGLVRASSPQKREFRKLISKGPSRAKIRISHVVSGLLADSFTLF